jgi:hypothetical protein
MSSCVKSKHFGRARLSDVAMILTEALVCLVATSGYANALAEPRPIVCRDEPDCSAKIHATILAKPRC